MDAYYKYMELGFINAGNQGEPKIVFIVITTLLNMWKWKIWKIKFAVFVVSVVTTRLDTMPEKADASMEGIHIYLL